MTDGDWHFCPFGDDGKGNGCIKLVRIDEPHDGPHLVVENEEDEWDD